MQQNIKIGAYQCGFSQNQFIGEGTFSKVYLGFESANPDNKVAIKLIEVKSPQEELTIRQEIGNTLIVHSQYTLPIYTFMKIQMGVVQKDYFAIVVQFMDGSLTDLLKQKKKLSQKEAIKWIWQIVVCYRVLYQRNLMHRDLKPDNVLFKKGQNNQLIFKICDFGLSRDAISITNKSMTIFIGTLGYLSPQQYKKGSYTNKTDVYALGAILFQFLNGYKQNLVQLEVTDWRSLEFDQKKFQSILKELSLSPLCQQFLKKCLQQKEQNRYSWLDVFTHKIFQDTGYLTKQDCQKLIKMYESNKEEKKENSKTQLQKKKQVISIQNNYQNKKQIKVRKVQQLLKGCDKIHLSSNTQIKLDLNNNTNCLISKELSMENKRNDDETKYHFAFYFSFKIKKLVNNYLTFGLVSKTRQNNKTYFDYITYSLHNKNLIKFKNKYQVEPYFSNCIKSFPSQVLVCMSQINQLIYFVYNNQIQVVTRFPQNMEKHKGKFYAFINFEKQSIIQFN